MTSHTMRVLAYHVRGVQFVKIDDIDETSFIQATSQFYKKPIDEHTNVVVVAVLVIMYSSNSDSPCENYVCFVIE
ncbi:hypothetical protein V1477_011383 [Vespula maculifrons]|uniref:Uncharacterized protein n=1 Tax=Vespula maculifrons TaxID=7453 RepID=A0ABD2C5G1_VESMC